MTLSLKCSTQTRCRRSCLEPIEPSKNRPNIFNNWARFNTQASPAQLSHRRMKSAPGKKSHTNRNQYRQMATRMPPACIEIMPQITETPHTRTRLNNSCLRTTIITHLCTSTIGYPSSSAKLTKCRSCLSSTTSVL